MGLRRWVFNFGEPFCRGWSDGAWFDLVFRGLPNYPATLWGLYRHRNVDLRMKGGHPSFISDLNTQAVFFVYRESNNDHGGLRTYQLLSRQGGLLLNLFEGFLSGACLSPFCDDRSMFKLLCLPLRGPPQTLRSRTLRASA